MTSEQICRLYTRHGGNAAAAARETGIPPRTMRRWFQAIASGIEPAVSSSRRRGDEAATGGSPDKSRAIAEVVGAWSDDDAAEMVDPGVVAKLRRELARKDVELKQARLEVRASAAATNLLEDVRDALAPVIEACTIDPPKATPQKAGKRPQKRSQQPVALVLHLTDLHWGEIVDPNTINGVNAYSPEIAARRVQHAIDTTLAWVDNYEQLGGVSEIVLAVNGDTVSGQHVIHPDSADEYARIATQVLDAALIIAQAAGDLAARVPRVRIIGTQGNHPRSTRRMPTGKARTETSWETLLHELVAAFLVKHSNIDYTIASGYRVICQIGPSTWAFAHGDAMKGGGGALGIPAYGLARSHGANREQSVTLAAMSDAGVGGIVKHSRFGHFHIYTSWGMGNGDATLCPSPKGVDSFVLDALGKISPAQVLLEAVHPVHDVIGQHLIGLQHVMSGEGGCRYRWGAGRGVPAATLLA